MRRFRCDDTDLPFSVNTGRDVLSRSRMEENGMARRTIGDIEKIWTNVEGVKKLSDRIIGIGPFGFGLF